MAENSPLTFRADEETKAEFAQICEQFDNKGAALQALIGAYELETAKGTFAGNADLIEDFRAHLDCISRAYIAQLDLNANAEQRIRTELSEELASLTKALHTAQEQAETAEQEKHKALAELEEMIALSESKSKAAAAQVADYVTRLESAGRAQKAAEETARAKEQTVSVLTEQLDAVRKEADSLRAAADQSVALQTAFDKAQRSVSELNAKLAEKETTAEMARKQAELDKERAVLAAERRLSGKLEELRDKVDALRVEQAVFKDTIQDLTAERDALRREIAERKQAE